MYHAKEGLYFDRLAHGDLRIIVTNDDCTPKIDRSNVIKEVILARSVVASIMATACQRGYTTDTFYGAYEFLQCPSDEPRVN